MSDAPAPPPENPEPSESPVDSLLARLQKITGLKHAPALRDEPAAEPYDRPPPVNQLMVWLRDGFATAVAIGIALAVLGAALLLGLGQRAVAGFRALQAKMSARRGGPDGTRGPSASIATKFSGWCRNAATGAVKLGTALTQRIAGAARWAGCRLAAMKSARKAVVVEPEKPSGEAVPAASLPEATPLPETPALPEASAAAPPVRRFPVRTLAVVVVLLLAGLTCYVVKPLRYFFTGLAGWGNAAVIVAPDGWLFPRRESDPAAQVPATPLRDTVAALKSRGAAVVVVSIPAKSAVYPEKLGAGSGELKRHPAVAAALQEVTAAGAVLVDLGPVLHGLKASQGSSGPVFSPHSSLWSPRAMQEGASAAALAVQQLPGFAALPLQPSLAVMQKDKGAATMEDLVTALHYSRVQQRYAAKEVDLIRLVSSGKREPLGSDPASAVTLLGGDAVALYDDPALGHPAKSAAGQSSSAGFAQYLAWHLSTPLDVHVSRGSGAEAAADWLKSRPEAELGGRKVIVWVISDAAILR